MEIMLELNYYFVSCSSGYTGGSLVIYSSVYAAILLVALLGVSSDSHWLLSPPLASCTCTHK